MTLVTIQRSINSTYISVIKKVDHGRNRTVVTPLIVKLDDTRLNQTRNISFLKITLTLR